MKAVRRLTDGLQATGCCSAHKKNRICWDVSVSSETVSPQVPRAHRQRVCSTNMRRPGAVPFAGCGCRAANELTCICQQNATSSEVVQAEGATGTPTESLLDEYAEAWCRPLRWLRVPSGKRADLYLSTKCDFVRSRAGRRCHGHSDRVFA